MPPWLWLSKSELNFYTTQLPPCSSVVLVLCGVNQHFHSLAHFLLTPLVPVTSSTTDHVLITDHFLTCHTPVPPCSPL